MFPRAREQAPEGEAPWWESVENLPEMRSPQSPPSEAEISPATDPVDTAQGTSTSAAESVTSDNTVEDEDRNASEPAAYQTKAAILTENRVFHGGMTARGAFLLLVICCAIGCGIGFLTSGTTSIPSQAGWGLVLGTVATALLSPPKLGWTVAWLPPLAAATVVAVLGQITLLGSTPTVAREIAMIAAGLTTLAPAQIVSVVIAIGLLALRRKMR